MTFSSAAIPSDPYSRYSVDAGDNDIGAIIKILHGRQNIIWICILCALAISSFYVLKLKPSYMATTKVMLSDHELPRRANIVQNLLENGQLNGADLLSQIQIMQSPEVIELLIVNQGLFRLPEFNGASTFDDFYMLPPERQRAIIASVKNNLSITPVSGTTIVDISFKSIDPVRAAQISNALVDVYAQSEERKSKEESQSAISWLADRLDILKEEVRQAETSLEAARQDKDMSLSNSQDSRLTKIELLTGRLSDNQAELAELSATLDAVQKTRTDHKSLDTIPNFMGDRLMENLKGAEAALLRKKAILEETYGPNHPDMIALKAEFSAFNDKLNYEIERYIETLVQKKEILENQINLIQKQIDDYRLSYQGDSEQRVKVRNLQTQAETARALLNSFTKSYLESLQNLNIDKTFIRVVSRALPPHSSNIPQKTIVVALSGISGLFLGILLALMIERVQNVIQTPQQLEKFLGLPVYAILPKVKMAKGEQPASFILDQAASPLAESIRSLFTTLQLRDPYHKGGGRVVTVTSTYSDEGKTTNAVWLATTAAQNGKKVLVIDADMRRPSLHKAYGIGNAKGLTDYLSDRLPLDDIIYKNHASGVHFVTSKAVPTHALILLASDRMDNMIRRMREMYDLIIIDAPTSLIFSDARILAKLSDKTLYIVEWKETDRDDLKESIKQYTDMGYTDIALILNKIDNKKLGHFDGRETAYLNYFKNPKRKGA